MWDTGDIDVVRRVQKIKGVKTKVEIARSVPARLAVLRPMSAGRPAINESPLSS
jgi:hypothetical protein